MTIYIYCYRAHYDAIVILARSSPQANSNQFSFPIYFDIVGESRNNLTHQGLYKIVYDCEAINILLD